MKKSPLGAGGWTSWASKVLPTPSRSVILESGCLSGTAPERCEAQAGVELTVGSPPLAFPFPVALRGGRGAAGAGAGAGGGTACREIPSEKGGVRGAAAGGRESRLDVCPAVRPSEVSGRGAPRRGAVSMAGERREGRRSGPGGGGGDRWGADRGRGGGRGESGPASPGGAEPPPVLPAPLRWRSLCSRVAEAARAG